MQPKRNTAERIAEDYYDSRDADRFYEVIWGGEDIHIGLYQPGLSIVDASRRTVAAMADQLTRLGPHSRVLDLGAGYGGAARYLAQRFACHVTCLNLSEVQNERNRQLTAAQGLGDKVEVLHGSFEEVPVADASFDVVWSQDAFLHSGARNQLMDEVNRVLKPGGELIFTDPMQADNCPEGVLQPVYDRLHLDSLASPGWYRQALRARAFTELDSQLLTDQLRNHYNNVRASLRERTPELSQAISQDYLTRMIDGLGHWVEAADKDYLAWGILHFRKPG